MKIRGIVFSGVMSAILMSVVGAKAATLNFLDDGMMQVKVSGTASTNSMGWNMETEDNITTFTKFGAADTLEIKF